MRYIDSANRSPDQTLGWLFQQLAADEVTEARIQSGFYSAGALGAISPVLSRLAQQKQFARVLIGSNEGSTLRDDVADLAALMGLPRYQGLLGIVEFGNAYFHPKTYHFVFADGRQVAYVGSSNLTEAGFALHVEAGLILDSAEGDSPHVLADIARAIDHWFVSCPPSLHRVHDVNDVQALASAGILALARPPYSGGLIGGQPAQPSSTKVFLTPSLVLPAKPNAGTTRISSGSSPPYAPMAHGPVAHPSPIHSSSISSQLNLSFVMTLQQTDVGVGQVTQGTSRRSPEVFNPLAARDANPSFWGWPNLFQHDPTKPGKMDRTNVHVQLGTQSFDMNMMTWPDKSDFRLRSEILRSAGSVGDILHLQNSTVPGTDYVARVVGQQDPTYPQILARCTNATRNSLRRWGYY